MEVPYRLNQKDFKPQFKPYAKARKRVLQKQINLDSSVVSAMNAFALFPAYGIWTRIVIDESLISLSSTDQHCYKFPIIKRIHVSGVPDY